MFSFSLTAGLLLYISTGHYLALLHQLASLLWLYYVDTTGINRLTHIAVFFMFYVHTVLYLSVHEALTQLNKNVALL